MNIELDTQFKLGGFLLNDEIIKQVTKDYMIKMTMTITANKKINNNF